MAGQNALLWSLSSKLGFIPSNTPSLSSSAAVNQEKLRASVLSLCRVGDYVSARLQPETRSTLHNRSPLVHNIPNAWRQLSLHRPHQVKNSHLKSTVQEAFAPPAEDLAHTRPSLDPADGSALSSNVISIEQYENIVAELWRRMTFKLPVLHHGASTFEANVAYLASLNLPEDIMRQATEISKGTAHFADLMYPANTVETRAYLGVFTTYLILIDDLPDKYFPDLSQFRHRLQNNLPHPDPIMQTWATLLKDLDKHLGPFSADMVFKSAVDFVTATAFELEQERQKASPPAGAKQFMTYFRPKTGIADPFAHFAFPEARYPEESYLCDYVYAIPEMINIICLVNDILSFYKESVAADKRDNFVYVYAKTHQMSLLEAFKATCDSIAESVDSARTILAANPEMAKNLEEQMQGYIAWHLWTPRYRLSEVRLASPGYATKVQGEGQN